MTEEIDFEFYKYKEKEIKNAMVVVSFPTIGMIGNIVANYLIKNLELERIGAIASSSFYPAAIVQDGVPTPPVRIFVGDHVCGPEGQCDQIVIITADLPIDKKAMMPLANRLIEWCKENNCEILTAIEGINKEDGMEIGEKPSVRVIASNQKAKQQIEALDAEYMEDGMVSGLSGVLLFNGNMIDYPIACILSDAHRKFPDSRSAAAVLRVLDKLLPNIEMDADPLIKQAESIERQIKMARSQITPNKDIDLESTEGLYA